MTFQNIDQILIEKAFKIICGAFIDSSVNGHGLQSSSGQAILEWVELYKEWNETL